MAKKNDEPEAKAAAPEAPAIDTRREQEKGGAKDPVGKPKHIGQTKAEPLEIGAAEPYPTGSAPAAVDGRPQNEIPAEE